MRTTSTLFALSTLSLASATVDISSVKRVSSAEVIPGAYIVELDKPNVLGRRSAVTPHAALYNALDSNGADWTLRQEYDVQGLFVGASVNINSDKDLMALAQVPHVISIKPVYLHGRPIPVSTYKPTGKNDPKVPVDTFSTHVMTGVDKLHAEGYSGKGIKIGIIDTGLDYMHPALGGGFGPGFKVDHGTDLVGDAYTGANTPVPDSDPMDCAGRTHVAGIIGANLDVNYNFTGVAPGSSLGSYRVFGCDGSVSDEVLIDALTLAYKDGNDILSLSLGGAQGWTSATTSVVASRIAATGRIVSIAAGNDGVYGSWYSSSPGTGVDVISVASVENTNLMIQSATLSDGHTIGYNSFLPLKVDGTHPIYAVSSDTTITNDACDPLPPSTPDLSPFVVIFRRGSCAFVQKLANIAAHGAKYALIYDNLDQALSGIEVGNYTAALITQADGKYLVGQFAAKANITITFPQTGGTINIQSPSGGLMSTFSTYGPTNDMFFKPSVAAPGGNILSTWPVAKGSYAILSGTSMATPFVAGSSALLLEAFGHNKLVYKGARTRFQTTASGIPSSRTDGDPLQTLSQAGAGLINVHKAVHATSFITPGELRLNDTAHATPFHVIFVENSAKTAQTYSISHSPAGTATTMQDSEAVPYPVPLTKAAASVSFSTTTLKVAPGAVGAFSVTIKAPTGLDPKTFPVYSGMIKITSAADDMQVSYLGVAAAMKDMHVIDTSSTYFGLPLPALLDASGNVQNGTASYTFQAQDFPTVLYRLNAGTAALHVDLVSPNATLDSAKKTAVLSKRVALLKDSQGVDAPQLARRDLLGWFWDWLFGRDTASTFAKFPINGQVAEAEYLSRNSNGDAAANGYNTVAFNPAAFVNGTAVPNGSYRFLLRALKITGDARKNEDYEKWLSPVITIAKP